jgi:hypothetical protein
MYPEERKNHLAYLRKTKNQIVGEFSTPEQATEELKKFLIAQCSKIKTRRSL